MKKRFTPALAVLASLAAVPAFAGTYFVPSPDLSGGRQETHVEVSPGGPRLLTPIFIPTGVDGSKLNGTATRVDNDEKPNVFNVRNFITGVGMLKLTGTGMQVRSSSMFLTIGANGVNWALPVLSDTDGFKTGEKAYLNGLAKSAVGASNIELINLSAVASTCQVQLVKPKGGALGVSRSFNLRPVSHLVVKDALNGFLETPGASNVRAEVSCNQQFYAYGTYLEPASLASFRMLYPLSAPSVADTETLTINRPGTFFSPSQGKSALDVVLPLVPDRAYRKVTIDYDVNIREFTPLFTGVLGMYHPGGPRFGKTLYFGTFIRGLRARTLVDQGSPVIEPALKFGTGWKEGATHHVSMVYDTEAGMIRFQASRNGAILADYTGAVYNYDLADRGSPVRLTFGLQGIADGAYFPPIGWKFSNLRIVITR